MLGRSRLLLGFGVALPVNVSVVNPERRRKETYPGLDATVSFGATTDALVADRLNLVRGQPDFYYPAWSRALSPKAMRRGALRVRVILAQPLTASDRTVSPELPDHRRWLRPPNATSGPTHPASLSACKFIVPHLIRKIGDLWLQTSY